MNWKSRVRNYGFWLAVISQVAVIVSMLNVVDMTQLETWKKFGMGVLELLVVLGIVNNPTDGKGFADSPK
jgi:uncharacterized membrane protein